jgi:hypothetical protein
MISNQDETYILWTLSLSYKDLRTSLLIGDEYVPPSFVDDDDDERNPAKLRLGIIRSK